MIECAFCDREYERENRFRTHMMVIHPDELGEDGRIPVSDGYLNHEVRAEKGEQFGYR